MFDKTRFQFLREIVDEKGAKIECADIWVKLKATKVSLSVPARHFVVKCIL